MNSAVCSVIVCQSPSSTSSLIFPSPNLLRIILLCSLYSGHSSRKCSTVSCPFWHSQLGLSVNPKRCRYLFSPQCPVRSCIVFAHVFLFDILLYSAGPCWFPFFVMIRFSVMNREMEREMDSEMDRRSRE